LAALSTFPRLRPLRAPNGQVAVVDPADVAVLPANAPPHVGPREQVEAVTQHVLRHLRRGHARLGVDGRNRGGDERVDPIAEGGVREPDHLVDHVGVEFCRRAGEQLLDRFSAGRRTGRYEAALPLFDVDVEYDGAWVEPSLLPEGGDEPIEWTHGPPMYGSPVPAATGGKPGSGPEHGRRESSEAQAIEGFRSVPYGRVESATGAAFEVVAGRAGRQDRGEARGGLRFERSAALGATRVLAI